MASDRGSTSTARLARAAAFTALAGAGLALANGALARRAERQLATGEFIEVDGVRLRYVARGDGPPVVLVHGNGTVLEDWIVSGVSDELARSHRVIAFDRPGFGGSGRPRGKGWTSPEQAQLLAGALARLGIERAIVVGHSIGTQIVLALALDHPQLVSRIVLVSGYYYPTRRLDDKLFAPPSIAVVGDVMRHTVSPWVSRAMAGPVSRKLFAPAQVPRRWKERFPIELAHRPSQIFALSSDSRQLVTTAAALCGRYRELALPIAIIAGDGDRVVDPQAQARRLHEELPHSRLIVVPDGGHMVHWLAPARIAEAVREA